MKKQPKIRSLVAFISHNKNDRDVAREVGLFLAAENINVWFDEWEISAGDSIVEEINKGLYNCTHFFIIWSKNAAMSNWVRKELQSILISAIESGNPRILPIILDGTTLPKLISDTRYIRYHGGTEEDRWDLINSVTGHNPSYTYVKAIVKKYHELIYDQHAKGPLAYAACPKCGSDQLIGSEYTDHKHDEVYYGIYCRECGWFDWT